MSLLLVVVLLFFSSSCSVSSGQYYVSDDCSSVTQSPCNPLSVYAGNMSQYNDTIFYFIGTSSINFNSSMSAMRNVSFCGFGQLPSIICSNDHPTTFKIMDSSYVTFSGMSFHNCRVDIRDSSNITVAESFFISLPNDGRFYGFHLLNALDSKLLSSVFLYVGCEFNYYPLSACHNELQHYTLKLNNVTLFGNPLELYVSHSTSYNLSISFNEVNVSSSVLDTAGITLLSFNSLVFFSMIKSTVYGSDRGLTLSILPYKSHAHVRAYCFHNATPFSTFLIEKSRFNDNKYGLLFIVDFSNISTKYICVKSCYICNNTFGLYFIGTILTSTDITIIDTALIGNKGNMIINWNRNILLSNVTIASSTNTGLTIKGSLVAVNNSLIVRNNTGIVGGGIAINDSSVVLLLPQATLNFIDNHASYKGGGIYIDRNSHVKPYYTDTNHDIHVLFQENSAGIVGDDLYGAMDHSFNLINKNISSSSEAVLLCFCDPDRTKISYYTCRHAVSPEKYIFPGQKLKFNVVLFGFDYFNLLSVTDGTVGIFVDGVIVNSTYVSSKCSKIEYTPSLQNYTRHFITLDVAPHSTLTSITTDFILYKCPIGFSMDDSQATCTCSQSVSRENVTCDINTLNMTHNGLLWIGTYDTSTPFNANETNPNACIINEDCLLYCSPNSVTFQLNDTDTQCVDNRGQRMCGSCRKEYSLLMGSNKCGQCHNNYMMIAWIALFAVMGLLLVVLLIALNLTVSVGTLNGLLFYANIVKLYEPVFSTKGALPVLSQVISWINLDFGFEICFYNGMDSYSKQWLQFAFPLYLWIIIIIIIQLCRRYGKISRLMGSNTVPVLSTLTFLSYTKLVRTIVIVLHKRQVTLHCTIESLESVSLWYEDPNVEYAKGKHAGLFGFALLVSVLFVIPYTLFLLFHPVLEKYLSHFKLFRSWSRFKPIIDAYSGPMKDEYRFWPGLLLIARIPIILNVTFLKNESRVLLLAVAAIILSLSFAFGGAYRKKSNSIIEFWFLLNLCIIASLSVAFTDESKVLIWYNTCLSVFLFSFSLIVVYHLYLQLSNMKCYDALIKKLCKKRDEDDEPLLDVTESHLTVDQQKREIIPSFTDVRRCASHESVVDLFY